MVIGPQPKKYSLSKHRKIQNKGFTLLEMMIVLFLLALIASIAMIVVSKMVTVFQKSPITLEYAKKFAGELGDTIIKVDCVDRDTNGNGYVTCTIFRKEKDPLSIECASRWSFNTGCKIALPQYPSRIF
jgi:prepilin-type N-terminal cleavage/methylation domain-containing protein